MSDSATPTRQDARPGGPALIGSVLWIVAVALLLIAISFGYHQLL